MTDKKVTITKIGEVESKPVSSTPTASAPSAPSAGQRQTKGILKTAKIRAVSDPAKSPPVKKSMKKHTIRLLTKKGTRQHRKTLRRKISTLSDSKVKQIASNYGLLKNPDTPVPILRQMIEGGAIAGFLSVD
jgi:hypothetical protein